MATRYVVAWPAYGRDYTSKKAVLADWKAGKDFRTDEGYVNINDKPANVTLEVRYKRLTMAMLIK